MRVWVCGDSGIRAAAAAYANALGADLVDTSTDNAIPESVWTEQIHEAAVRRQQYLDTPVTAILYLPGDYDSENTIIQIRRRLPPGSRIIAVVDPNASPHTLDGFTHERDVPVSVLPFGSALN